MHSESMISDEEGSWYQSDEEGQEVRDGAMTRLEDYIPRRTEDEIDDEFVTSEEEQTLDMGVDFSLEEEMDGDSDMLSINSLGTESGLCNRVDLDDTIEDARKLWGIENEERSIRATSEVLLEPITLIPQVCFEFTNNVQEEANEDEHVEQERDKMGSMGYEGDIILALEARRQERIILGKHDHGQNREDTVGVQQLDQVREENETLRNMGIHLTTSKRRRGEAWAKRELKNLVTNVKYDRKKECGGSNRSP